VFRDSHGLEITPGGKRKGKGKNKDEEEEEEGARSAGRCARRHACVSQVYLRKGTENHSINVGSRWTHVAIQGLGLEGLGFRRRVLGKGAVIGGSWIAASSSYLMYAILFFK